MMRRDPYRVALFVMLNMSQGIGSSDVVWLAAVSGTVLFQIE
jgi:hypothetical protein